MMVSAIELMVPAVGLAAPACADTTDDAFTANLNSTPEKTIQAAKFAVSGTFNDHPNTSNANLFAKVIEKVIAKHIEAKTPGSDPAANALPLGSPTAAM